LDVRRRSKELDADAAGEARPVADLEGVAVDGRHRAVGADENVAVIEVADDEAGLVHRGNETGHIGGYMHEETEVGARKEAHAPAGL
jgi:hypothetical protein